MIQVAQKELSNSISTEVAYGDLTLAFTYNFNFIWNDRGSRAKKDIAFWKPIPPRDFFSLGSVGITNYEDPNENFETAAICVKATPGHSGIAPLTNPEGYERVWGDKGSGANKNGSCWRPIPKRGYVALGDVFVKGNSPFKIPPLDLVKCVRQDLVNLGVIGDNLWTQGIVEPGFPMPKRIRFLEAYEINTESTYVNPENILIAVNSFVGNFENLSMGQFPDKPNTPVYTLKLPVPVEEGPEPPAPELENFDQPPPQTEPVIDRTLIVPFTSVKDDSRTLKWKVENSPFYKIEREAYYNRLNYINNETGTLPEVKTDKYYYGITTEESETFSEKSGISITATAGAKFKAFSASVSGTITKELGWQRSRGVTEFVSDDSTITLTVPPASAAGIWVFAYSINVRRWDRDLVGESTIRFQEDSYVRSEYPGADDGPTITFFKGGNLE